MSFDGFMTLGGREILNSSRLAQMIAAGKGPDGIECKDCAPCPDLDLGLGHPGGYNPSTNPWYSADEPDSADFAGLLVTSITGLEPGEFTRPVTEAAGIGAVLGQGRQVAPQVVVTGILMGATCCSVDYGLRWLRQALRGACVPGAQCGGEDLVVLSCEPAFPDADCVANPIALAACIAACGGNADCEADCAAANEPIDYPALLAPYYRTFKGAALVSGPTVTQIIPRACPECHDCGLMEVSATLSAADPCMYHEPIVVAEAVEFVCEDTSADCIEWVTDGTGCNDADCPPPADCATDPNCQDTSPPAMPAILNPCVYECISGLLCRACFTIPADLVPATTEGALALSIFSGDAELRRIQISIWDNPLGLPVDDLDACDVISQLDISYMAANSTLSIDGAGRTATIACPGGTTVRANPFIAGRGGIPSFTYPTLSCGGGPYTACVTAAGPIGTGAFIQASLVPREC